MNLIDFSLKLSFSKKMRPKAATDFRKSAPKKVAKVMKKLRSQGNIRSNFWNRMF